MYRVLVMIVVSLSEALPRRKNEREYRAIVPQLLPNYTTSTLPPAHQVGCNAAWLACRYRDGCGGALHQYMNSCEGLVSGNTTQCDVNCRMALIALISTIEGERLMECECEDEDCREQKARVEPCRSSVQSLVSPNSIVSCTTAGYVCMSDPGCNTALQYYNTNCQAMFEGKKCNKRCKNSLEILLKQNQSNKLINCNCDGTENFECESIKLNMERLCYENKTLESTNSVETTTLKTLVEEDENKKETEFIHERNSSRKSSYLVISILVTFINGYIGNIVQSTFNSYLIL